MQKKIHDATQAQIDQQRICFYCKRFFCAGYHYPSSRMVCSGALPQWNWLYFLMRDVKPTDTCRKFIVDKIWDNKINER